MAKQKQPSSILESLPESYTFLIPVINAFTAKEASLDGSNFLSLPPERRQYFIDIQKQFIDQPLENVLALNKFYKKYPLKKYAETQKLHLFLSQLAMWREARVLDKLPKQLTYLAPLARQLDLWDVDEVEVFIAEKATAEDQKILKEAYGRYLENNHASLITAFFVTYPQDFYHESMLLTQLLVVMARFGEDKRET